MSPLTSLVLALCSAGQLQAEAELRPQPHALELGFYGGAFLPSSRHGLSAESGAMVQLDRAGLDFAVRLAYSPFTFLGVEAEAGHVAIDSEAFGEAGLYTLRGHVVGQYPGRFTPFVLAGAGLLGLTGAADGMGSDKVVAGHWGTGVKLYLLEAVSVRAEGRHTIAPGEGGGLAHHFEILTGLTFTLVSAGS